MLALAAAATLGGCSTTGVLNAVEPRAGAVTRDLAYGEGPRHRLDVYAPRKAAGAPVVVFFYGGSWDSGSRGDYAFVGKALAGKGYLAVVPDYRLYPEVRYPEFIRDSARAVAWARAHAAEYGGDPARLVLMGHSAGAYNAAMLALDRRWLGEVGMDPRLHIRAMVGLAGPYDFLPLQSETLKAIFGPEAQRPATQPIAYVDGTNPPLWLAHDEGDKLVESANTTRLAAAVRAKGGPVEERYYGGLNHQLMVGVIAFPLRFLAPVLREASAFIDAQVDR
ncbi:MAG: esterase [Caulobacterales bacterium 32-69-10]|nr:MAG: esterase [Caulobacterales bacterium 32-69-10]